MPPLRGEISGEVPTRHRGSVRLRLTAPLPIPLPALTGFKLGAPSGKKPHRGDQGIGRGVAKRNPCEQALQDNNPARGDRLCCKDLLPPRWGLNGCVLLQGLHSASPRYTPAYDLTAPNGAFTGQPNDYLQYHAQARPTGGIVVGDHGKARGLELRQPHGAQADRSVWRGGKSMNRAGLEDGHGNIRSLRREGEK